MTSPTQEAVRAILREHGPLTIDETAARLRLRTRNPKNTVRNAVGEDPIVVNSGDRRPARYVYLPAAINGATVRQPMPAEALEGGLLVVSLEALALLWPNQQTAETRPPRLALADGQEVSVEPGGDHPFMTWTHRQRAIKLPEPFWRWWDRQRRAGVDALLIRCEDGEMGRYAVSPLVSERLDPDAVEASNIRLVEAAKRAAGSQHVMVDDFYRRLLARGVYHGDVPPDPAEALLFDQPTQFILESDFVVEYRPDLTPAMLRLFGDRIVAERVDRMLILDALLGVTFGDATEQEADGADEDVERLDALIASGELFFGSDLPDRIAGEEELDDDEFPAVELTTRTPEADETAYRFKVSLEWKRSVWRAIEMLGGQSLEDLHLAIQHAFGWDNEHLYAFFLSGKRWDRLTEVCGPPSWINPDYLPPTAREITISQLALVPGQEILYIFDFGDEISHLIRMERSFTPKPSEKYPRLAAKRGEAAPQYPPAEDWDEEWGDESWEMFGVGFAEGGEAADNTVSDQGAI